MYPAAVTGLSHCFRYNETVMRVKSQFKPLVQVEMMWIRVNAGRSAVTAALTEGWANSDVDVVISMVDECATQLELTSAWNLPIFTSVSADKIIHCRLTG